MTPVDILKAARAKIADPEHWTQKAFARAADSHCCAVNEEAACRWCALGAIMAVEPDWNGVEFATACAALDEQAALEIGLDEFVKFNDLRTHKEVLELFDAAIASLEAKR